MQLPRNRHQRWRRAGSSVVASALAAGLLLVAPAQGDTGDPPDFLRTLGGPLHAEMHPGGLEVAPDGTIVIADTGNDQVAKYTKKGRELWRIGTTGSGKKRFSDPRDIGIDAKGRIYVADARNKRIVKLSPKGKWLDTFAGPGMGIPIGVTVRDKLVYVADSGSNQRIRVFSLGGRQRRGITDPGSGECDLQEPRDADADPQGNIYVANYTLHNIVKFSRTGACLGSWGTGEPGDTTHTPYGIKLAKDPVLGRRLAYVALGNVDRVEIFQLNGVKVGMFGSTGDASVPGRFTELRRVAVAKDGDVWAADLWGWKLERFNRTGSGWSYAQRIGDPLPAATRRHVFHQPHQVAFEANGTLAIVDTVNHRFVRMTPSGRIVSVCGQRGAQTGQYNWPRGIAVDPLLGTVDQTHFWVANTKQYNIHIVRSDTCLAAPPAGGVQSRFGSNGTGLDQFNWPHSVVIRSDRIALIADTNNDRIVSYDVATRTPVDTYGSRGGPQLARPAAVGLDPVSGHLFVADTNNNRIVELEVASGGASFDVVRTYTAGFRKPQGVAVDPQGRIVVADTGRDRMVVLRPNGSVLGTVTGLHGPESVSVDPAGRIYLSDTYADRVLVYRAYGPL